MYPSPFLDLCIPYPSHMVDLCFANCPHSLLRSLFHNTNASPTSMILPRSTMTRATRQLASFRASTREGIFAIPYSFQRTRLHAKLVHPTSTLCHCPQAGLSHTSIVCSFAPSYVAVQSFSFPKARAVFRLHLDKSTSTRRDTLRPTSPFNRDCLPQSSFLCTPPLLHPSDEPSNPKNRCC